MSAEEAQKERVASGYTTAEVLKAWMPWVILSLLVFIWGLPQAKDWLNGLSILKFPIDGLDKMVIRIPPVGLKPTPYTRSTGSRPRARESSSPRSSRAS